MPDHPKLQPGEVLYQIHSKPDNLGRVSFTKHWLTDYRPGHPEQEYDPEGRLPKSQCFFAQVEPRIRLSKRNGFKVRVSHGLEEL